MNRFVIHATLWLSGLMWFPALANAQGAIVNEFSNGPAGNQEFVELVVVGPDLNPNCGPVNLVGWIVDDNNGDFSCGACAGTGIASGHIRFGATGPWAAVPTGSIIVVYDPGTKNARIPADDPTDTAPADGVYILPTSHASIETAVTPCAAGQIPNAAGACGSCSGNIAYAGACYTAGVVNTTTGLRNTGDAAQVRRPNGTYYHGVGYGSVASLINGGADGLFFAGDGTGRYYAFTNASNDNYRAVANFVTGTVASLGETPGAANSANNGVWITSLTVPCPLAVNYYEELTAKANDATNLLEWITASENNCDRWEVMRALDSGEGFVEIGEVQAKGNSNQLTKYAFLDPNPQQPKVWYQIRQFDIDGGFSISNVVEANNRKINEEFMLISPNPSTGKFALEANLKSAHHLEITDMLGRKVFEQVLDARADYLKLDLDLSALGAGNYVLKLRGMNGSFTKRILIKP